MKKIRCNHNNLYNYLVYDDKLLPQSYVRKCKKFFKELNEKRKQKQMEVVWTIR